MTQDGAEHEHEVGSLGEEAGRLLGALSGWVRDHAGDADAAVDDVVRQAAGLADGVREHARRPEECAWCPLCQGIARVRQVSPEVRAHLLSAGVSLAQALQALLATEPHSEGGGGTGPARERQDIALDDDESR